MMREELKNKTILITGATGLIGKAFVRRIMELNRQEDAGIRLIACVRDAGKAEGLFGKEDEFLRFAVGDIRTVDLSGVQADYIVHAASQTSSKGFVEQPVQTILTAVQGTEHILEYARSAAVKKLIFLSTMEVYGYPATDEKIREDHSTDIDPMKVRSCYPESKRLCECLCASYGAQYGIPVSVLRLTQTFGPGVGYADGRVFAEFARCVLERRNIVLKTKGETKRSYLHVEDAVSAILCALVLGESGEAYNAANENTYCSIYEMAQLVCGTFGDGRMQVEIREGNIADFGFAPTLHMNLDTEKLRRLGWKPQHDLKDMFRDMIADMKKTRP